MKTVLFLSLIIFLLQTFSLSSASLDETCKKASRTNGGVTYDFCMTSLQVIPESHTADPKGLVFIAAKLARANFTSTMTKIRDLVNKKEVGDEARAALTECSTVYDFGTHHIDSAVDSIKSGDLSTAKIEIGVASMSVSKCASGLDDAKVKSVLDKENENAVRLTSILQVFTHFIG